MTTAGRSGTWSRADVLGLLLYGSFETHAGFYGPAVLGWIFPRMPCTGPPECALNGLENVCRYEAVNAFTY